MATQQHPTLINLPPPPSDPVTPSEAPGTPNSTTTSMSELSTVAIKDGHRGHFSHPHHHPQDAERADRISRLAGLERVVARQNIGTLVAGGTGANNPPTAFFDANNQPQILRDRSTVGSASATGSVGGRTTTWASGSDMFEPDRMSVSEDQENETASMSGFSDEAASLVGFGEGARTPARQHSQAGMSSPSVSKATAVPQHMREQAPSSPMTGISSAASVGSTQTTPSTEAQQHDAKIIDGMTYDKGVLDTSDRTPPSAELARDPAVPPTSEQVISERLTQQGHGQQDV